MNPDGSIQAVHTAILRQAAPGDRVGIAGFTTLLIDASLINRSDHPLAEQYAIREQMPFADAGVVVLGLVRDEENYAKLAEAGGF